MNREIKEHPNTKDISIFLTLANFSNKDGISMLLLIENGSVVAVEVTNEILGKSKTIHNLEELDNFDWDLV